MNELPTALKKIRGKLYTTNEYGVEYQSTEARLSEKDVEELGKRFGIRTDVHNMCINCQARQLIKYYGAKDKDGNPVPIQPKCSFVPRSLDITKSTLERVMASEGMSREKALRYLKSTMDPVAWVSMVFQFDDSREDWKLRPYQKEVLRCNSLRHVMRWGRRAGKSFSVCLKLLYLVFNKTYVSGYDEKGEPHLTGPEIMIVTPYQSQIENLFNELERLLKINSVLVKTCTTGSGGTLYTKTPFFRMEFTNGAKISGFVSGVGTKLDGSGGGTMRGRNAHIMYLDEMDMIPDEILDKVIRPILLTSDDVMLMASSTPIGKRFTFYKWCLESPHFKEDYYPSSVLPQWQNMARELEAENSQEAFRAEYMAEFIDGSYGVFKPSYVWGARQDYSYEDCLRPSWWSKVARVRDTSDLVKVIGIDWNKNAGTEFVVVAYDPNRHHWFVIDSTNVAGNEFSSIKWKEEVLRLNYLHKPNYIYADEGYGHTIIEDLKLLAHQMRIKKTNNKMDLETAKLVERLVAFNFSSKVELVSPVDGTPIKKTGKEYLVENTLRIFEDGRIWYPEEEEVLRQQLLNYVVLRRSATTNKPIYGVDNVRIGDHRLDALMLALGGLSLEYSVYSKSAAPLSSPTYIPKDVLERRTASKNGASALELLANAAGQADKYGSRHFRMEQGEFLKAASDLHPGKTESGRGNIRKSKAESVLESMFSRAADYRGYSTDNEHLYRETNTSGVVRPRRFSRARRR